VDRARGLVISPLRYAGGKSRLVPRLRPWLAQQGLRVLLEPFAGGASVSLAAVAEGLIERAVFVERDDDVAAFWQVAVGAEAPELARRVRAFRATEPAVDAALAMAPAHLVDRAFQSLLRNRVSRAGIMHPRAGRLRRGEADRGVGSRWYPDTLADRILDIAALRSRITFIHGDGMELLAAHAGDRSVGAFIDAPYTVGERRVGERLYAHADVDHRRLFELAAAFAGPALLTYADTAEVRLLATRSGFDVGRLQMQSSHHARSAELLISRDLRLLRQPLRRRDILARRNPSASAAKVRNAMTPSDACDALHVTAAAERLGVSRRTVERLIADGRLARAQGPDARSYVTAVSVAAAELQKVEPLRRGHAAEELALVLGSMDKLLAALRDDRAALLQALRAELAALREALEVDTATTEVELAAPQLASATG
jgi:DNA adenine methylase